MGMSIDEAIEHGKEQLEIFGGTHKEFIETSLDTMRKYQKFQDQSLSLYMERLKADMVAMLTEIQLEIEEQKRDELSYQQTWNHPLNVCISIIQQKIDKLNEVTIDEACKNCSFDCTNGKCYGKLYMEVEDGNNAGND